MLNLPIKILDRIVVGAGGVPDVTLTLGNLVTLWDAQEGITSRHLVVIVNAAYSQAVNEVEIAVTFNGDAGANYNRQDFQGRDAVASAAISGGSTRFYPCYIPGTNYTDAFGSALFLIPHAFNTVNHKNYLCISGAVEERVMLSAGRWASAAVITSIELLRTNNFAEGSEFLLGVIDERYLVPNGEVLLAADGTPTFDNIPQGEGDLVVIGYPRSDEGINQWDSIRWFFNDDTVGGLYSCQQLYGSGVATAAVVLTNQLGQAPTSADDPNIFGGFFATISQYTKANQPHYLAVSGYHDSSLPLAYVYATSGRRANVEPVNKIHIYPDTGTDFKAGSLFSLYRVPKRLIDRVELTVDTAVPITLFTNIPDHFEVLVLHMYARSDRGLVEDTVYFYFNNDGVNSARQHLYGNGGAVGANRGGLRTFLIAAADNAPVGEFSGGTLFLPGYARTDGHKHSLGISGEESYLSLVSGRWQSMAAINRIDVTLSGGTVFRSGTVFELEGVLRREGLPADAGMRIGIP